MAVRNILTLGHPELRKAGEPVDLSKVKKRNFQALLKDMFETMDANDGVGLAAPQMGISLRFFVKGFEKSSRYPDQVPVQREVVINPSIKFLTKEVSDFWEGCLSLPGMRGLVQRPNKIEVEYHDEKLKAHKKVLTGFEAIVFQHEYDHLQGTLFLKYVTNPANIWREKDLNEYLEKYETYPDIQ